MDIYSAIHGILVESEYFVHAVQSRKLEKKGSEEYG